MQKYLCGYKWRHWVLWHINFDKNINKPIKPRMHCKLPGLLKDELANTEIKEGIFDDTKAYILTCSNSEKIKKWATKKTIVK